MAHRMFSDASGREWLVWDVIPVSADPRGEGPRQMEVSVEPGAGAAGSVAHLPGAFASGWLCFESGAEKRRLAPIPEGWEKAQAGELIRVLERAAVVSGRETRLDTGRMRALTRTEPPAARRDRDASR